MVTAGTSSGESQRERTSAALEICPPPRWWSRGRIATSAIDAGIHVQDRTVHAPAGLCADKDCETISLLKWRLDRYVLKTERRAGNGGHRGPHPAMFCRG